MSNFFAIKFVDGNLVFLDQTKLPLDKVYVTTDNLERIAEAIELLEVRGAPQIGVAAAYGLALAFKNIDTDNQSRFIQAFNRLAATRPTAVNLFYALERQKKVFEQNKDAANLYDFLLEEAQKIHNEDINSCEMIGQNGLRIFAKKSNILTHCNTGALATGGDGTAFSVIKTAYKKGLVNHVYADETRPLFQGSRLTAFELFENDIPFSIQTDSSAAVLMQQKKIDLVITGADRITLNGDSANKIGTYNLAVLCNFHRIPFFIAAPETTIDRKTLSGEDIQIEYRHKNEVLQFKDSQISSPSFDVFCPAFDVTPSHLITGIITEKAIYNFPYNFII